MNKSIIQKLAAESKQSERVVSLILEKISFNLIREGCKETDPQYLPYLMRRARKRLKIAESTTYKTFKEFFDTKKEN